MIDFSEYLAVMLEGGLTLSDAIEDCGRVFSRGKVGILAVELSAHLRAGIPLSALLERHPNVFPAAYRRLVAAGEQGGTLERVFREIAAHLKESERTRSRLVASLSYPAGVLLALSGFVAALLLFLLPKLTMLSDSFSGQAAAELERVTRILVAEIAAVFGATSSLGAAAAVLVLLHRRGVPLADALLLKIPVVGPLHLALQMKLFATAMEVLVAAAVSAEVALWEAAALLENRVLRNAVLAACAAVERGGSLAAVVDSEPALPERLRRALAAGERAGSLAGTLPRLAEYYRWECERRLTALATLAEPALLALCGAAVAVLVLTVVVPLLGLLGNAV